MQGGNPAGRRLDDNGSRLSAVSLLGLALIALLSEPAGATSVFRFENHRENVGMWRLLPEIGLFSTTENYDQTGAKAAVPNLQSYKKTQFDFTAVYGYSPKLSFFGRLSMASVSFTGNGGSLTGSGSGLTEQGLGANYRLWESKGTSGSRPTTIDGQIQVDIPLYDNTSARTATPTRMPLRGDGTLDLTAAAFGTMPLNQGPGQKLYLVAGLGYDIRSKGYSKAIPYQLQVVGLPATSGILYRLGFHGFKSMTSDPTTGTALTPQSESAPGVVDQQDAARSLIVDALNSSYLQLRATVGYQWSTDGDQAFATYLLPMSGTSTAAISGFILGAQFRFGSGAKPGSASRSRTSTRLKGRLRYDLQGHVKQSNDRLNLVKIDKGSNDGMEKGQVVDIYRTGPDGRAKDLVARGVVTGVTADESVVNLRQYKKEVWIQRGFLFRRITTKP